MSKRCHFRTMLLLVLLLFYCFCLISVCCRAFHFLFISSSDTHNNEILILFFETDDERRCSLSLSLSLKTCCKQSDNGPTKSIHIDRFFFFIPLPFIFVLHPDSNTKNRMKDKSVYNGFALALFSIQIKLT